MNLTDLNGPQLLALYNASATVLGERVVNKFSDRMTARKRTEAIYERLTEDLKTSACVAAGLRPSRIDDVHEALQAEQPVPETTQETLVARVQEAIKAVPGSDAVIQQALSAGKLTGAELQPVKAPRKVRGMRFVFPVGDEIKEARKGTNRALLIELMSRPEGATFDECMAETWGKSTVMDDETKRKTTYEGIRLVHYYCGYGMSQDAEGRIRLRIK